MDERYDRRRDASFAEDDVWDEPSGRRRGHRQRRTSEEDLDYRHMEVLEFEDDDYCYYVEAVPKKAEFYAGGRHG